VPVPRRLALTLLALVAAACGSAAPASAPASGGASTPPERAAGAGPTAAPAALVPMRFGINTTAFNSTPAWVTKDEGFFAKYGIDAEITLIPGGETIVAALVAGEIPLTILASTALVNATLGGADLAFFGCFDDRLRFWLYGRPEITSVRDLRGKQVAITGRAGIIRRATELALERNGLQPDQDVTYVATGNMPNSYQALVAGNVDAATLSPPSIFQANDAGFRMLADTGDYAYKTVLSGLAGSRRWVARNEDLTRRALQAIAEGVAFSRQNKERTKQIAGKYMQTDDAELLERSYTTLTPAWERTLYVPPDALRSDLEALAQENPAARNARPEQFFDNRFVDELERAGFFQQLYR
jgi:ABC-type nitrate/sulfonate/bicarbonate transport system substrate-binding protein